MYVLSRVLSELYGGKAYQLVLCLLAEADPTFWDNFFEQLAATNRVSSLNC